MRGSVVSQVVRRGRRDPFDKLTAGLGAPADFGFVVSHPSCDENKDVARMGHPRILQLSNHLQFETRLWSGTGQSLKRIETVGGLKLDRLRWNETNGA
jgi:hypothetical protein